MTLANKNLMASLVFFVLNFSLFAAEPSDFQSRVGSVSKQLESLANPELTGKIAREIILASKEAAALIGEITNHAHIADEEERALVSRLVEAYGRLVETVGEGFSDPTDTESLDDWKHQSSTPASVMSWIGSRLGYGMKSLLRDTHSFIGLGYRENDGWFSFPPPAWWFIGKDARRSKVFHQLVSNLGKVMKKEMKEAGTSESAKKQVIEMLKTMIEAVTPSEPLRTANYHNLARGIYFLSGLFFYFFPIEIGEPTTAGPEIFGLFYISLGALLAAVRTQNSGLKGYNDAQELRKLAGLPYEKAGILNSCARVLRLLFPGRKS